MRITYAGRCVGTARDQVAALSCTDPRTAWRMKGESDRFQLVDVISGRCLTAGEQYDTASFNGGGIWTVRLASCSNAPAQRWKRPRFSDGVPRLISVPTGAALSIGKEFGGKRPPTAFILYGAYTGSADQRITLVASTQRDASRTATTLNDDAPGMTYSGTWHTSTGRGYTGDYNQDVHYTTANGDAFSYTFTGTGIDFRSEKYSDQGLVDFYLDGELQATVDTTNPTRLSQQLLYSRRGLPHGRHTLKAVKRSGTYMLVDRIDIYAG
jgi:hypothetical protein